MIDTPRPLAPELCATSRTPDSAMLLEQLTTLRRENAALRAEKAVLQERIRELEARLGQNSSNSSRPPSMGWLLQRGQESLDRRAAGLCRELLKWWPALWTFARVEGVEPTNYGAERALRPAVLWRKGSFGSDGAAGSQFAERLLTGVASCRRQGRPLLSFPVAAGEAALLGDRPPSLLRVA